MCGRFVQFGSWAELRKTLVLSALPEVPPNYNVAPTQQVLVARQQDGQRAGVLMRWGLIPSWAKDKKMAQINARADTAAEKPMFRSAFKKRRCLVLANGYYEWSKVGKEKHPFLYQLKDGRAFGFAGLWETWNGDGAPLDTCTILTTDANELARQVHDRMPVILEGGSVDAWLDPAVEDPKSLVQLLLPFPADQMKCVPVSPLVNSVKNNSPECVSISGPEARVESPE